MDKPVVFAIGSCRVLRPLRRLAGAGEIMLTNNAAPSWFTHSAGEALQYARALTGDVEIPGELRPFICETDASLPRDLSAPHALHADVAVVEVSTLKVMRAGGLRLNYHRVWGEAKRLDLDPRPILSGVTDALPAEHPLRAMTVGRATVDDVRDELEQLRELAELPLLAVDHLWAHMPDGTIAPEREAIVETLSTVAATSPIGFWSTRQVLDRDGAAALKDHNHWASDHEDTVGESIVTAGLRLAPAFA